MRDLVERMLKSSGRRVDLSSPFVDATLPDGSRLHVVIPDITGTVRRIRPLVQGSWRRVRAKNSASGRAELPGAGRRDGPGRLSVAHGRPRRRHHPCGQIQMTGQQRPLPASRSATGPASRSRRRRRRMPPRRWDQWCTRRWCRARTSGRGPGTPGRRGPARHRLDLGGDHVPGTAAQGDLKAMFVPADFTLRRAQRSAPQVRPRWPRRHLLPARGLAPGGWRSWSRPWASPGCRSPRSR